MLTADKVLVTIGTPCSISAVGSTETYRARVVNAPEFIALAAFDAGLVDIDPQADGSLKLRWVNGESTSLAEIEQRHGAQLRASLGIRYIDELTALGNSVVTDVAASLPHDFDRGGLRRLAGLTYRDVRDSALKDMYGLFDDDPRLGPSLQSQLFAYSGLGALAALPVSLVGADSPIRMSFASPAPRPSLVSMRSDNCARPAPSRRRTTSCAINSRCDWRTRCRRMDRHCCRPCSRRLTR